MPHGSALGPLLFFLHVNDLPSSSNCKTTLFADDTLLQLSDCNIKKLEKRVNNELNKINVWLRNNKISLTRFFPVFPKGNITCICNKFCY